MFLIKKENVYISQDICIVCLCEIQYIFRLGTCYHIDQSMGHIRFIDNKFNKRSLNFVRVGQSKNARAYIKQHRVLN